MAMDCTLCGGKLTFEEKNYGSQEACRAVSSSFVPMFLPSIPPVSFSLFVRGVRPAGARGQGWNLPVHYWHPAFSLSSIASRFRL